MAHFSKAPRFDGKVVLSKTSLIGTVSDNYIENSRSKAPGFVSPMKASRTRASNISQQFPLGMHSAEDIGRAEKWKEHLAQKRKVDIENMKEKQKQFREMMEREDAEINQRAEQKHKQIWADIRERRKLDKMKFEADERDKAARREAFRVKIEKREAAEEKKRQTESARIRKVIAKREADHQANLERYRRMAQEELKREEEEARRAGTPLYKLL